MERPNPIDQLSYADQAKHYTRSRTNVEGRLKAVQKLYESFKKSHNQEKKTLFTEIVVKGFTHSINEMECHLAHLDKKLTMLSIIIRDQQNGS